MANEEKPPISHADFPHRLFLDRRKIVHQEEANKAQEVGSTALKQEAETIEAQ